MEALLKATTQTGTPPESPAPASQTSIAEGSFHDIVSDLMPPASTPTRSNESSKSSCHIAKGEKGKEVKGDDDVRIPSQEDPQSIAVPVVIAPQQQLTPTPELVATCAPTSAGPEATVGTQDEKRPEPAEDEISGTNNAEAKASVSDDQQPTEKIASSDVPTTKLPVLSEPQIPDEKTPLSAPLPNDSCEPIVSSINDLAPAHRDKVSVDGLPTNSSTFQKRVRTELRTSIVASQSPQNQRAEDPPSTDPSPRPSEAAAKNAGKSTEHRESVSAPLAVSQQIAVKNNPGIAEAVTQADSTTAAKHTQSTVSQPYPSPVTSANASTSTVTATHEGSDSSFNAAQSRFEPVPQIQSADLHHRASTDELKVELKIAELGRVQVSASVHDEGVHAVVKVENSDVRNVIANEFGRTESAVGRHEITVQGFDTSFTAGNNNSQSQNRQQQPTARPYFLQSQAWKSTNPSPITTSLVPASDRGIDLLA